MAQVKFTSTGGVSADSSIVINQGDGNNKTGYLSAGGGYSTGSGLNGVKVVVTHQSDCISGLGQDVSGSPYTLSLVTSGGANNSPAGIIEFMSHATASTTYTRLGYIQAGNLTMTGEITGSAVYNAVWNDLADAIEVPENTELEYGYCYCFDGINYYKSTKYLDDCILGIHSDTYGFKMGIKETKTLDVAVSGFVLAYVDREYKPGTPLTSGPSGILTEISLEDKIKYPEKIVGIFYKAEPKLEWGVEDRKVQVNGRCWIKVK